MASRDRKLDCVSEIDGRSRKLLSVAVSRYSFRSMSGTELQAKPLEALGFDVIVRFTFCARTTPPKAIIIETSSANDLFIVTIIKKASVKFYHRSF